MAATTADRPPKKPRTPKGRAARGGAAAGRGVPGRALRARLPHPFQLLAATILSAQTTDVRVNMVTPALFARYPDAGGAGRAPTWPSCRRSSAATGFYVNKSKSLVGMAQALVDRFDGEVPTRLEDLVTHPRRRPQDRATWCAAWRSTARAPGRHPCRPAGPPPRPDQGAGPGEGGAGAELLPASGRERADFSLRMILHGRRVCLARKPLCEMCVLADICPSARLPSWPARRAGRASNRRNA